MHVLQHPCRATAGDLHLPSMSPLSGACCFTRVHGEMGFSHGLFSAVRARLLDAARDALEHEPRVVSCGSQSHDTSRWCATSNLIVGEGGAL